MYIAGLKDLALEAITTLEHAGARCMVMIAEIHEFRFYRPELNDDAWWVQDIITSGLHSLQEQLGDTYKDMNVLAEAYRIWESRKKSKGFQTDVHVFLKFYTGLCVPSEEMVARVTDLVSTKEYEKEES